jgi:hypothetical protein
VVTMLKCQLHSRPGTLKRYSFTHSFIYSFIQLIFTVNATLESCLVVSTKAKQTQVEGSQT